MTYTDDIPFLEEHVNVIPFLAEEGEFYFTLGVKAFRKREFEKAERWLTRAMELAPDDPLYPCQLSILYTETKSFHKANQLLTKVLQEFGDSYVDCYYLIANNYAHLGLFQDAQKNIELYLEKEPEGDFKNEANQLLELLKLYNEELDEEDEDDEWLFDEEDELLVYQESAFYYLEHQEWEKALPVLEEMMTLYPDYIAAKHDYAWALFFSGDEEEAVELEIEWHKQNPNSIHSIVNLATFYYEMGEFERSEGYIEQLQNVYPIHEQQSLKIASALAHTEHFEWAYERFEQLSKAKLKNHMSYFRWYSRTAYQIGLETKAKELWKEGCRRHPFLKQFEHAKNDR
ncbi:tetratricopeptide repeat protein [Salinibacillus xinjiangensis]|uniref:Uncharacterized protein n=1 Tax=Salinibacillus xinjiangensis TaxID=1229268 RepID=A0A6G1X1C5_9BACI|nr:hypothetical protein [Salinibacillus xinjiangensis]MRG84734.1 hypothetical protein [Salinibacillus xinjiangensis]